MIPQAADDACCLLPDKGSRDKTNHCIVEVELPCMVESERFCLDLDSASLLPPGRKGKQS